MSKPTTEIVAFDGQLCKYGTDFGLRSSFSPETIVFAGPDHGTMTEKGREFLQSLPEGTRIQLIVRVFEGEQASDFYSNDR